ncbi:LCP family protein [Ornithinimicrobium avium]|uniref:LytR family transcriptional regulator n=1 Tax=Ornithinimicrobium avium TaxID=2283195 RepID=A0A345NSG4_9MICO|nr:LCP family protein [Ornithinimicrobium avium]AXH97972.1 LytR family transcriptional regulator [Ornithinimicrobium avium]
MPHHPQDDWSRPVPRSSARGRGDGRRDDRRAAPGDDDWDDGWDDGRTRALPQSRDDGWADRYRDASPDDRYAEAYDGRGSPPPRPPRRRRPRYGFRRFMATLMLLVVAYVVSMAVVVAMVWGSVGRVEATPRVADRPGASSGASYLLVGTDSREQLTQEQQSAFGTGFAEGHRADTVMLLHVPTIGDPTLVSLPRDSFVTIRDHGQNKLNAAHSIGGPPLLVDTVEQATGIRIDGYLEIGFGGFVQVVDKVGGVHMCLAAPAKDKKAHVDLQAGCQDLTGPEALGYVRMRYNDSRGDLGRVERQRQFLAALVEEMTGPATLLNPVRLHSVGTATGRALSLGENTSMLEAGRIALAMRAISNGNGQSVTVPVADVNYMTGVGSTVLWNEQGAAALFDALRRGDPISVQP